jgi:hypothetical protein
VTADPATLRRTRRTVPRMRPHADPAACTRPPAGYVCSRTEGHPGPCPAWPTSTVTPDQRLATAVVTVTCALRPGQEFPDVHVGAAHGRTWLGALDGAMTEATRSVPPGVPFAVSSMRRR